MKNPNELLVAEMRNIVREAAEPRQPVDSMKAAVGRAAQALGLTYRRATSLWYGYDTLKITPEEAAHLRAERERLLALRIERLDRELAELRAQQGRLDAEKGNRLAGREAAGSGQAPLTWGAA